MAEHIEGVSGGVDTHKDVHVAAVVDTAGRILGTASFAATPQGYRRLLAWMGSFGSLVRVGVEGTGAYGAGLARHLSCEGVDVVEVNRPNRQARRRRGKNDTVDAEAAARAALNGDATVTRSRAMASSSRSASCASRSRRCAIPEPGSRTRSGT